MGILKQIKKFIKNSINIRIECKNQTFKYVYSNLYISYFFLIFFYLEVGEQLMNVNYRNYEPNKGLEEFQAMIFNQANKRAVTAKEIQERYEKEKIDPKTVRYAFSNDNQPLAYVQARDYQAFGETHIGYPWTMPECPPEVKNKLYDDLLAYVKTRNTGLKLKMHVHPDRIDFATKRGFKEERNNIRYKIDFDLLKKYTESESKYTLRKATEDDLESIKNGYLEAYQFSNASDSERIAKYTKERFNENHLVVAFHENTVIGASAPFIKGDSPSPDNEANLIPRFFYTKLGHEDVIPLLFKKSMDLSIEANWDNNSILITFSDENPDEIKNLDKISSEKTIMGIKLGIDL